MPEKNLLPNQHILKQLFLSAIALACVGFSWSAPKVVQTPLARPLPEHRAQVVKARPVGPCPALGQAPALMLDSSTPPDQPTASALKTGAGASIYAGYMYSYYAFNPWAKSDFDTIRAAGLYAVPIYVAPFSNMSGPSGTSDAAQAVSEAKQLGFAGGPIILDVEPDAYNLNPGGMLQYAVTWTNAVRQAGYSAWGYGTSQFLDDAATTGNAAMFDAVWLAWYDDSLTSLPDPHASLYDAGSVWTKPGQRLRQYIGTTTLAPVPTMQVDLTSADPQITHWLRKGSNC